MMTVDEFEQKLQTLLKRTPFRPFSIELDDGERWQVDAKENVMYLGGPTGVYFGPDMFMAFLECHNVVRFHELEVAPTA